MLAFLAIPVVALMTFLASFVPNDGSVVIYQFAASITGAFHNAIDIVRDASNAGYHNTVNVITDAGTAGWDIIVPTPVTTVSTTTERFVKHHTMIEHRAIEGPTVTITEFPTYPTGIATKITLTGEDGSQFAPSRFLTTAIAVDNWLQKQNWLILTLMFIIVFMMIFRFLKAIENATSSPSQSPPDDRPKPPSQRSHSQSSKHPSRPDHSEPTARQEQSPSHGPPQSSRNDHTESNARQEQIPPQGPPHLSSNDSSKSIDRQEPGPSQNRIDTPTNDSAAHEDTLSASYPIHFNGLLPPRRETPLSYQDDVLPLPRPDSPVLATIMRNRSLFTRHNARSDDLSYTRRSDTSRYRDSSRPAGVELLSPQRESSVATHDPSTGESSGFTSFSHIEPQSSSAEHDPPQPTESLAAHDGGNQSSPSPEPAIPETGSEEQALTREAETSIWLTPEDKATTKKLLDENPDIFADILGLEGDGSDQSDEPDAQSGANQMTTLAVEETFDAAEEEQASQHEEEEDNWSPPYDSPPSPTPNSEADPEIAGEEHASEPEKVEDDWSPPYDAPPSATDAAIRDPNTSQQSNVGSARLEQKQHVEQHPPQQPVNTVPNAAPPQSTQPTVGQAQDPDADLYTDPSPPLAAQVRAPAHPAPPPMPLLPPPAQSLAQLPGLMESTRPQPQQAGFSSAPRPPRQDFVFSFPRPGPQRSGLNQSSTINPVPRLFGPPVPQPAWEPAAPVPSTLPLPSTNAAASPSTPPVPQQALSSKVEKFLNGELTDSKKLTFKERQQMLDLGFEYVRQRICDSEGGSYAKGGRAYNNANILQEVRKRAMR